MLSTVRIRTRRATSGTRNLTYDVILIPSIFLIKSTRAAHHLYKSVMTHTNPPIPRVGDDPAYWWAPSSFDPTILPPAALPPSDSRPTGGLQLHVEPRRALVYVDGWSLASSTRSVATTTIWISLLGHTASTSWPPTTILSSSRSWCRPAGRRPIEDG